MTYMDIKSQNRVLSCRAFEASDLGLELVDRLRRLSNLGLLLASTRGVPRQAVGIVGLQRGDISLMGPRRCGPGCCLCCVRLCVTLRNGAPGAWSAKTMVCRPEAFPFFVVSGKAVAWDV